MHRWEALAVMTVWEVRGARHSSRHRATAVSMVTASKVRPSSSAFSVRFIDASSAETADIDRADTIAPDDGYV